MAKTDDTHKGHRDRMRKKFLLNSLDGFEPHESLELLLYYAVPRKDTNPLAHRLLDAFGSISAVFDAPIDALMQEGLTQSAAILVKLLPQMSRLYMDDKHNNDKKIIRGSAIGEILLHKFIARDYETVVLLLLDAKYKEVFCGVISKGSVSACELYVRKIVEHSLLYNATYAVLAHNHPSGVALPSQEDLNATMQVASALDLIHVSLIDHVVVADNDYVSIAQSGILREVFDN